MITNSHIFDTHEELVEYLIDLKNSFKSNIITVSEFDTLWVYTINANKELIDKRCQEYNTNNN